MSFPCQDESSDGSKHIKALQKIGIVYFFQTNSTIDLELLRTNRLFLF